MSNHLDFLRNLQRLLDEGNFVATYKYALLQSLADLAVEGEPDPDGSMRLPVTAIAEKFIQYYWRQTLPYRGADEVLLQNPGKQAAVVNYVADTRGKYAGKLSAARRDTQEWRALRTKVSSVIRGMPLWKLQLVAGSEHEFLYRKSEYHRGSIRLLPQAVRSFRDMYVIIINFVRGAWIGHIQKLGPNHRILGKAAGLPEFLFGSPRDSLDRYKSVLQDHQQSRCFYCDSKTAKGDLDHFIPWSRYPIDLGHNFVFAHSECNQRKKDFLAHPDHLVKWKERNLDEMAKLAEAFDESGLIHDATRSRQVAIWAYEQGEASKSHVWRQGKEFLPLDSSWHRVFAH